MCVCDGTWFGSVWFGLAIDPSRLLTLCLAFPRLATTHLTAYVLSVFWIGFGWWTWNCRNRICIFVQLHVIVSHSLEVHSTHLFNWSCSYSVTVSHSHCVSLSVPLFLSHIFCFVLFWVIIVIDLFALNHSLDLSCCLFNIKTINLITLIITISGKAIWMHQIDKWQTGW